MQPPQNLRRQLVDARLDVLKHAKQNHVVDTSPNKNDGEAFVHARLGHGHRGLADFFRFTEKDALRARLARVEWVGLKLYVSYSPHPVYIVSSECEGETVKGHTQNHGTVLQIAPAIMGAPNGDLSEPSSLAATCLTVS
jgi:hypothetical protein